MRKNVVLFLFTLLFFITSLSYAQPTSAPLEVTEEDGAPSTFPYQLKFPNTSITDNADNTVSIDFIGGTLPTTYLKLDCSNDPLTGDLDLGSNDFTTTGTISGTTLQATGLTAGSVVFSDGTNLTEDNTNLYWDDTNNKLGIGTTSPLDTLHIVGSELIVHTSIEADDHAFEIDTDAAGYGDVKAIDIVYDTGAIATGEDEGVILVNIDDLDSTGGDVFGLEVLATEGSAGIYGMKVGVDIGPVHQDSGSFANPTTGTDNTPSTDVSAMIDGSTGTTTAIFENDNEYIIIGAASAFEEMEIVLTTEASVSVKPTFAYSTVGSGQFTTFSPVDGTNGFRNNGVVAWDASDLSGHTTNDDTSTYDIKITRTRNTMTTTPVLGYAKTASTTEYIWDKNGDLKIRDVYIGSSSADSRRVYYGIDEDSYDEFDGDSRNIVANNATSTDDLEMTAETFKFTADATNGAIDYIANNSETRIYANSTGYLGVDWDDSLGTTVDGGLHVGGGGSGLVYVDKYTTTSAGCPVISLRRSDTNTVGSHAATDSGDYLGAINFYGSGSSNWGYLTGRIFCKQSAVGDGYGTIHLEAGAGYGATVNDQLILQKDGDVGINDSNPTRELTVSGDMMIEDDTPHLCFRDTDDNTAYEWHYETDASGAPWQGLALWDGTDTGTNAGFSIADSWPEIFVDLNNNVEIDCKDHTLYVDAVNNRVGIGKIGAGAKLDVAGSSILGDGSDTCTVKDILVLDGRTSDPTSPSDGSIWRRSDLDDELRYRANGVTYKLMMTGI